MRWAILAIGLAAAAPGADEGLTSATGLVESREKGALIVKAGENGSVRFTVDRRSMIERDRKVIGLDAVEPGDKVEVLWRRDGETQLAELIKVVAWKREPRPVITAKMLLPYGNEPLVPRGRLTFAGIVSKIDGRKLTMRTRAGEEKIFELRRDTRYKQSGAAVDASALTVPTRIFVRAGMSLDDQLEIYEVIWGDIVEPQQ